MTRRLWLPALVALVLAGCGSSRSGTTTTATCRPPTETRALATLDDDLAALKAAGRQHAEDTLLGGPAANRATDRFLLDLARAPIDNLARNRLIDHAAAAVVGNCQQCFQALEAARPIPAIAHGEPGSCAARP